MAVFKLMPYSLLIVRKEGNFSPAFHIPVFICQAIVPAIF